jgi:carbon storage regulator
MLVLSRKAGEQIVVGDDVRITVVSIRGKQVRLGVTAPGCVRVYREEVYRQLGPDGGLLPQPCPAAAATGQPGPRTRSRPRVVKPAGRPCAR